MIFLVVDEAPMAIDGRWRGKRREGGGRWRPTVAPRP